MVSRMISLLIEDPNLFLSFDDAFSKPSVVLWICLQPIIRKPMDKRSGLTKSWNNTCGALLVTNKTTGLTFSHLPSSPTTTLCMHLRELLHFSQTTVSTPASTFLFPLTLSILLRRTGVVGKTGYKGKKGPKASEPPSWDIKVGREAWEGGSDFGEDEVLLDWEPHPFSISCLLSSFGLHGQLCSCRKPTCFRHSFPVVSLCVGVCIGS